MNARRRQTATAAGGLALALALTACAAPSGTGRESATDVSDGEITVLAAASLTSTFTELADEFESAHPGASVTLSFAGSSDLVTQIVEGAPADLFASADETTMQVLVDRELVDTESLVTVATNALQIAVAPTNPQGITGLADLVDLDVATVVCAPQVPCGAAAAAVEKAAGVRITPVSEELSVTAVLGKVTSGEADAGLVYVTDVLAAGNAVDGIPFPESRQAVNTYPVAVLKDAPNADVARAFVAFVAGPTGRRVLADAGFTPPEGSHW